MRTSRIAQDTARITKALAPAKVISGRSTRTSLRSIATNHNVSKVKPAEAQNDDDDDGNDSSLSSAVSDVSFDIEDHRPPKKRKRGTDTPSSEAVPANGSESAATRVKREGGNSTKKPRRQPAKKVIKEDGEVEIHPPSGWEEMYDAVKEMRKGVWAPVDTMGCSSLADKKQTPRDQRFQTLIALMLSSQTKDTTNAEAMRRLQTELPSPGLTLENILELDPVKLNKMIYIVGFHNNKTRYIKAAAAILKEKFNSDIPDTIEGLMSLPGVGPKMAYLCMSVAWGRTEGIGVDVHVHRITNLWRWHKTKTPEETRLALQAWLPKDRWHDINHLLVGFGQTICLPVGRHCEDCTLSVNRRCPSAVVGTKRAVKKVKKEEVIDTGAEMVKTEKMEVVVKEEDVLAEDV